MLPPFEDIDAYASGTGDVPHRFYMTPEYERLSDWVLCAADTTMLPVHGQLMCLFSGTYRDMVTSVGGPSESVNFGQDVSLASALAVLRFAYDHASLDPSAVKVLLASGHACGALTLAHAYDFAFVPELCSLCLNGGSAQDLGSLMDVATRLDSTILINGCYNMVARKATNGKVSSTDGYLSFVKGLGTNVDMLQVALLSVFMHDARPPGTTLKMLLHDAPEATYTWLTTTYQRNNYGTSHMSSWVSVDDREYRLVLYPSGLDDGTPEVSLFLEVKNAEDLPLKAVEATFRMLAMSGKAHVSKDMSCEYGGVFRRAGIQSFASLDEFSACMDDYNNVIFQVDVKHV